MFQNNDENQLKTDQFIALNDMNRPVSQTINYENQQIMRYHVFHLSIYDSRRIAFYIYVHNRKLVFLERCSQPERINYPVNGSVSQ